MCLNIVILNDFAYINGGAAKVAIDEAIELANQGHNVFFFSAVGPVCTELLESKVVTQCLNQGELIRNSNKIKAFMQGLWNFKAYSELKSLLKSLDNSNTIIHLHGWTKALSSSVIKVANKLQFKTVVTLHDYFGYCPNGGLFNYRANKCCELKPMSLKCVLSNCDSRSFLFKIYRVIRQIIQKNYGGVPDKIGSYISISSATEKIADHMGGSEKNVFALQNPIELGVRNADHSLGGDYYLYIGRVSQEKGVDVFCEACSRVNVKGVVVGDGPLLSKYKSHYPDNEFTGWLNHAEITQKLQHAKALISSPYLVETFGLTVYEALSVGVPCLVASHTVAADAIEDGKNGFKFDGLDDLCQRVEMVENQPDLLVSLKKNTYDMSGSFGFSVQQHTVKLIDIYKVILNNRSFEGEIECS